MTNMVRQEWAFAQASADFQPVIAPEQLLADGEGRRAEQAARCRLLGLAPERVLVPRRIRRGERRLRIDAEPGENGAKRRILADVLLPGVVRGEHGAGEGGRPALSLAGKREPRGLQPALRKLRRRQIEGQTLGLADARQVAPHIAALGGEDVEGRVVPALRLEDRAEQEGSPAHANSGLRRQPPDAHGGRVGIGAAELVPELQFAHDVARLPTQLLSYSACACEPRDPDARGEA